MDTVYFKSSVLSMRDNVTIYKAWQLQNLWHMIIHVTQCTTTMYSINLMWGSGQSHTDI